MAKRVSNGWAERAKEILEKERQSEFPKPFVGCDCECHNICHTCGNPFTEYNRVHVNCGDMAGSQSSWNYFGMGGYGAFKD